MTTTCDPADGGGGGATVDAANDVAAPALRVAGLTKRYDRKAVLDRVSLTVPTGSVLGLLGKNGAGKTTLIKCALGLVRPDAGEVTLLGESARSLGPAAKA